MKKYIHYLTYFLIITGAALNAQDRKERKASKEFDNFQYVDAISSFEYLVSKGYNHLEIYEKLAEANYKNGQYIEASNWYAELFEFQNIYIDPELYYRYAQSLKSLNQYEKSNKLMKQFSELQPEDIRAKRYLDDEDYATEIEVNSGRYTLRELTINSSYSDIAPTLYADQLVFSTARDTGLLSKNIHTWDNQPFRDIYSAPILEDGSLGTPSQFSKPLNLRGEESSTTFSTDGKTMYFTRNNSNKNSFMRDNEGITNLKIFKATLVDSVWTDVKELPFNGEDFSTAHPSLSADGTKLYFASDRPGSRGDSDIYVVEVKEDGTFGQPTNLGDSINTEARETFPFISDDNMLYFASDGHPGLGGLDVFTAAMSEGVNTGPVMNVGEPVNSPVDDFGYIVDTETSLGYFVSNREGFGNDDIYGFKEEIPLNMEIETELTGVVLDANDRAPLAMTKLILLQENGDEISEVLSEEDGSFTMKAKLDSGTYFLVAEKAKYDTYRDTLDILSGKHIKDKEVLLRKIIPTTGDDLADILNLEYPVLYFDFDKADILPESEVVLNKVIEYMNEYPNLSIEIRSHTDARGSDSYNMRLSKRRAKNTLEYLTANGISESRLKSQGFGETQLKNDCVDWDACSEEENRLNRRSEFIIVSITTPSE